MKVFFSFKLKFVYFQTKFNGNECLGVILVSFKGIFDVRMNNNKLENFAYKLR